MIANRKNKLNPALNIYKGCKARISRILFLYFKNFLSKKDDDHSSRINIAIELKQPTQMTMQGNI